MVYAKAVVQQSLRSQPPAWHWVGNTSWIVWFVNVFGFQTVWVRDVLSLRIFLTLQGLYPMASIQSGEAAEGKQAPVKGRFDRY